MCFNGFLRRKGDSSMSEGALSMPPQREIVREVIETLCYISFLSERENSFTAPAEWGGLFYIGVLPDGNFIAVGVNPFSLLESLFLCGFIGKEASRLQDPFFRSSASVCKPISCRQCRACSVVRLSPQSGRLLRT